MILYFWLQMLAENVSLRIWEHQNRPTFTAQLRSGSTWVVAWTCWGQWMWWHNSKKHKKIFRIMEDGWWMKIFTIPFGSQVACCQTPTTHKSSWRDEGPQRLTIHSRRATYDLIWCEIWFDIFNYLSYLSTYSILIFVDQHHMGSFLLPLIPHKPPLRARHSSSTCHLKWCNDSSTWLKTIDLASGWLGA